MAGVKGARWAESTVAVAFSDVGEVSLAIEATEIGSIDDYAQGNAPQGVPAVDLAPLAPIQPGSAAQPQHLGFSRIDRLEELLQARALVVEEHLLVGRRRPRVLEALALAEERAHVAQDQVLA